MTPTDDLFVSERSLPTSRPDNRGRENGVVRYLVEHGPVPMHELPGRLTDGGTREVAAKLQVRPNMEGAAKARGRTTDIAYLYGEERRAVRRFIDENTAYVRDCLTDRQSPIHEHSLYELFVEEWVWREWREDGSGGGE